VNTNLTICTVSYGHSELIEINVKLSQRLNCNNVINAVWKVADNAYDDDTLHFTFRNNNVQLFNGSPNKSLGGSNHHAEALDILIKNVNTRFLLVLDPDFYLLKSNWMYDVLSHMQNNNIAIFGAPWHPRYNQNYRYFPAVHCMFIDLFRIAKERLNFRPLLNRLISTELTNRNLVDFIPMLAKRRRISWDTGIRIYEDIISDTAVNTEYVVQTFRHGTEYSLKTKLIQLLLPDEYCYFPKNKLSYTISGFYERGLISSPIPVLWEETFWNDAPFGLHIRGNYNKDVRDKNEEIHLLQKIISELT